MSDELKPCPFCGSTNLSIETNSVQPDDFHDAHVVCNDCYAGGRHAMTLEGWLSSKDEAKAEAIVAWNRRAENAELRAKVEEASQPQEPCQHLVRTSDGKTAECDICGAVGEIINPNWEPRWQASPPSQSVDERDEFEKAVIGFLLGEGELEGAWFGDEPPPGEAPFWWRKHLRAALNGGKQ